MKKMKWLILCLILVGFKLTLSCAKDDEDVNTKQLNWNLNRIPSGDLPANGGTLDLDVNWAYTQWIISVEEVLEGEDFIESISPRVAGSESAGSTNTTVSIRYKENTNYKKNVIRIILEATDGSGEKFERTLSQAGKKVVPISININKNINYQTISGFGGGNMMWGTDFLNANEIKIAFGTGEGELGLSIYRVRLSPVRDDWPALVETVKEAKKYGATIIASPWSPPAAFKSNNDLVGGELLEENYAAYANYLNDFVQFMAGQGAAVDVVSIQNEPDIQVGYESSDWTAEQIYDFIKNHAGTIQGARVTAAESFNFKQSYTDQILNDPEALANLDIVSGHIYGGGLAPYPLAEEKGVEVWMTEYLMNQNSGSDINNWNKEEAVIWEESMSMIETIHGAMVSNWNAYIWWYIRRFYSFLGDGELGTVRGETLRRGDAMAQYAKHARPGYTRISAGLSEPGDVNITAYSGEEKIVIVLINKGESSIPAIELELQEGFNSVKATTTSLNHRQSELDVTTVDRVASLNIPERSVTTVVME